MKKIFFIVFTMFLMCGCQAKDKEPLVFKGKSENWSVEEKVYSKIDKGNEENKKIILEYKGNDVKSVGDFEFKVEAPNGQWGIADIQLNDEGVFMNDSKGPVSRKIFKSDELKIIINWKDKTESFPLKNIE